MSRYDLKNLSLENPPCRSCRLVEGRVREAYERGVRHGTRAEHERHEEMRAWEAHERTRQAMRDRHRRDTAKLHVGALLALCGSLLLVLMLGGYR